jgi:hypothetical protein
MKTKFFGVALALLLAVVPLAASAGVSGGNSNSNWTVYAWQNWGLNFRQQDVASIDATDPIGADAVTRVRETDDIVMDNGAANIGFAASIDTGVTMGGTAVKANFQCELFTYFNRFSDFAFNDWCSRNSKLGLSGPWGEVMFSAWLTPYNEITAQWIDPFYDADNQTHSTLMGLSGFGSGYGNGGFDGANGAGMAQIGFMRRKPELWQWFSPNWGGLNVRVAWSNTTHNFGHEEQQVTDALGVVQEVDPSMLSIGAAYTANLASGDEVWFGVGYQVHDDWAALNFACSDSDDETLRIAGRYIHDWGNGHSTRVSLAYEEMSWEWDDCGTTGNSAGPMDIAESTGGNVDAERDVWLISGKHDFPGPLDFRFMYAEADDWDCGNGSATAGKDCAAISENDSGAQQISLGFYYTLPAGTELRVVYGEVDNESNSQNDWGINGAGVVQGGKAETWQFGVVQWF